MKLARPAPPRDWLEEADPHGPGIVLEVGRGAGCNSIPGWTAFCCTVLPAVLYGGAALLFGFVPLGLPMGIWLLGVLWLLLETETWHVSPSRLEVRRGLFSFRRSRKLFRGSKLLVRGPSAGNASLVVVDQAKSEYLRSPRDCEQVLALAALLASQTGWSIEYSSPETMLVSALDAATDPPDFGRLQLLLEERAVLPLLAQIVSVRSDKSPLLQLLRECNANRRSLEAALGDPHATVRGAAIDLLVRLRDRDALPSIRQLFAGDEPGIRLRAIRAMGVLRDPEALALLSWAVTRRDEVSAAAARALGLIGNPDAVPLLCEVVRDDGPDWNTSVEAAEALGRLADRRGVPALCAALCEANPPVRAAAAAALGELGDPAVVPQLCQVLKSRDAGIAAAASRSLGKIGDDRAIEPLCHAVHTAVATTRGEAAIALGRLGGVQAVNVLTSALTDAEWKVRLAAAMALGRIAARRNPPPIQIRAALPLLVRLASVLSTERAEVRNACREAAQQIEARTAEIKGLPLPAGPGLPTTDTLPRVVDTLEQKAGDPR